MSQPKIKFYYRKATIGKVGKPAFDNTLYTVKTEYLSHSVREGLIKMKEAAPESIIVKMGVVHISDEYFFNIRKEINMDRRILPNTVNDYVCIYEDANLQRLLFMLRPASCEEQDIENTEKHIKETEEKLKRLNDIKESELGTLTYETFKPILRKFVDKGENFNKDILPVMYKDFKNQIIHLTVKEWMKEYMKDWTLEKNNLALKEIAYTL